MNDGWNVCGYDTNMAILPANEWAHHKPWCDWLMVISKLDCNNALLYKFPDILISKLQMVQNNGARLIVKKRKHDRLEYGGKVLHWLPIEYRITYKILMLA